MQMDKRKMNAVWILRVGLTLELLGGALLALDVLEPRIRENLREKVRQSIKKEEILWHYVFQFLLIIYLFYGFVVFYLSFKIEMQFVVFPFIVLPVEIPLWLMLVYSTGVVMVNIKFYDTAFKYYLLIPAALLYPLAHITDEFQDVKMLLSGDIRTIAKNLILFIYLSPVLLLGSIPVIPALIVIYSTRLVLLPWRAGFLLEKNSVVVSGLRLVGILFLSIGFLIQIIWTFI